MRILIDIGHPAHVHLFKNFAYKMQQKNNVVFFTCREKEFEIDLLTKYGFNFTSFGKKFKSNAGKLFGLLKFNLYELLTSLKFRPDIFLSHGSMYAAQTAFLCRKPHISLEDSGNKEQIRLYRPFTQVILTPDVLWENLGKKQIRYNGYHELAYLHPNRFNPQDNPFSEMTEKKVAIIRFVSWNATHDSGQSGINLEEKLSLIDLLSKRFKVFISAESELPPELVKYKFNLPPDRMHDALYYADLFVGEGATMAAEAGVLGTPSVYINSIRRSYCVDLEKYGLVYNFSNFGKAQKKIYELIQMHELKQEWQNRRQKMLADKIDVTAFLIWFVENYPDCTQILKRNPDYHMKFKQQSSEIFL